MGKGRGGWGGGGGQRESVSEAKEGETERENSNSKTLMLKDSSVRSIWTYLTQVLAKLQTQINTTVPQTNIISMIKQLINAVSQFLQLCKNIRIKFLSWAYMYTTLTCLGKRVIQTNPSKFDERLFSDIYLCRLRLKQGTEIHDFIF